MRELIRKFQSWYYKEDMKWAMRCAVDRGIKAAYLNRYKSPPVLPLIPEDPIHRLPRWMREEVMLREGEIARDAGHRLDQGQPFDVDSIQRAKDAS